VPEVTEIKSQAQDVPWRWALLESPERRSEMSEAV